MRSFTLASSVILACFIVFTSLEAQEITQGLILAFSFEEGAGDAVKDLALQGNDGKIEGTPKWVDGKLGKAIYFDGGTYVVAPHIPFDKRDFTVQLWVKPELNTEQETVFTQHDASGTNTSLHLRIYNTGVVRFGFYSNDLDSAPASVQKGQWHNLTFMFNASDNTRKIYLDGKELATDISPSPYLGAKGDTIIAVWDRPDKPPFYQVYQGAIDEVRVWNRLLEEDEMIASMETEMSVTPQQKLATTWGGLKH